MPITRRDYFKPIQIGGCVLWLDGADSSTITGTSPVTQWRDKSTSACSVFSSGGSPTYTRTAALSLGCVSFNGSTDYLTIGNFTDLQPNTMFIIATLNSLSTNASYAFIAQSDDSGYPADGLGAAFFYYASGGTPYLMPWAGITGATTNPPLYFSAGATYIYSVLFNGASSGVGYNGNFTSGVNPGTVGWKNLRLGANWPLNAFQSINVAEVIFYSSALSTTQRQQVEAYLAQKWSLTGSLPAGHPGLTSVLYRPVTNTLTKSVYYTQFSPKTIQNCQLWLDAADLTSMTIASGSISQWNDKSGNGYSFVNNATFTPWNFGSIYYPTITYSGLNKQNIVSFNTQSLGSVDIFPSGNAQSFSMFLVGTSYMGRGEDGYGSGWSISFPDYLGSIVFVGSGALGYTMTNGTGLLNYLEVTQGSTSVITTYNSGSLVQTQSPVNNTLRSSTIGFQIGRRSGYYRNGYIAEILVYSRVLSNPERQLVESYLSQKWGLTAALPASHINNTFPAGSPVALQTYITNIQTNVGYIPFLPGTPSINAPTNTGNITTLTMTWSSAVIASGYIVYILANGSPVGGTGIGTGGTQTLGNVLTASFTPMTTNVPYSYYVVGTGSTGIGVASPTSATTTYYATPGTPTINTPTNTGSILNMSWNAPTGTTTYYTVYVLVNGSAATTLSPISGLSTTYTPMISAAAYSFYVTATNTIAAATSGSSSTSTPDIIYYAAPGTPSINTPTNTGNLTTLTMTWNAASGTVTGYIVYILAGGNLVAGTGIGTGGTQTLGNVLTASFSPMTTNLGYSYYVAATGPGGTGVTSSTSTPDIFYYATPGAPTVGTATNTGNLSTLTMTWTAGSGTTTYYTVYVVVGGSTVATLTPGNVLTTTYSMTTNLSYTFYVTGTNTIAGATSESSATSSGAIYYAPPGQATVSTPTNTGNSTTLTMTWSAASGTVTNYTVYILANNIQVAGTSIGTGGTQALGNVLTASFSPMTTNVLYTFYVIALNNGIAGTQSTTSSSAIYYATPDAPTVNTPTNTLDTLNMSWNAPAQTVTSYTVYVRAASSLVATLTPGLVTSTTYSPMTQSVAYSFYVTATNGTVTSGVSTTSAAVTYTPALVLPSPPYWLAGGTANPNNAVLAFSGNRGINWTNIPLGFTGTVYCVAYNGSNLFVMGGTFSSCLYTSSNGIDWTANGQTLLTGIYSVVYAANISTWVAVGNGASNTIIYSTNGTTWNGAGSIMTTQVLGVAYNGTNLFVAIGYGGSFRLATSVNGISWTGRTTSAFPTYGYGISYSSNGTWLATGTGNPNVAYSTDGTTWTSTVHIASMTNGYGTAFLSNTYLVCGTAGGVFTSANLTSWTQTVPGITAYAISANSNTAICASAGSTTTFSRSENGTTWSSVPLSSASMFTNSVQGLCHVP